MKPNLGTCIIVGLLLVLTNSCQVEELAFKGQSITVLVDPSLEELFTNVLGTFGQETGATWELKTAELGSMAATLREAGGEAPADIMIVVHDILGEFVASGILAPFDLGSLKDNLLPGAVEAFLYDGAYYGLPLGTENLALIRNPILVPQVPQTFDELVLIAGSLESRGLAIHGFNRQQGDPYHFYPILTAFGGYIFGLGAQGYNPSDLGLSSSGSLAAARWLSGQVGRGIIKPGQDYASVHNGFTLGQTGMIITGPWALETIKSSGVPYLVSPIPQGTESAKPFLGVVGAVMSSKVAFPRAVDSFMRNYLGTEFFAHLFGGASGRIPAQLTARASLVDPDAIAFAKAGEDGMPMPSIPEMAFVWESLDRAISSITAGAEPEAAMATAQEAIAAAIKSKQ